MTSRILRYLQGYLRIRITGHTVERFINACSYKGIKLWNLESQESFYEMNITIKDFKRLKPVIRKTRTKVMIVERTGFPFFLKQYHHRQIFILGFFICLLLIQLCSNYVWNIEIKGNHMYATEYIMKYLDSIETNCGMKVKDVDCNDISSKIRQNFDDIIWVSAFVEGTSLIIHVKENEDSKDMSVIPDEKTPYDLVSDDTYIITRVVVRTGISDIKTGDTVKTGDLLVSGQIPVYNDAKEIINYLYCTADADIYGKTTIVYEDIIDYQTYNKNFYNIKKSEYFCVIGDYRFCFGNIENEYEDFVKRSKQNEVGIITYGIREAMPYKKQKKMYTTSEIQQILTANFQYYCRELEKKGVVILKNNVKIYTWSDKAKAKGTITVEMPIGRKVKSELIETGDYIDGNDGNNN